MASPYLLISANSLDVSLARAQKTDLSKLINKNPNCVKCKMYENKLHIKVKKKNGLQSLAVMAATSNDVNKRYILAKVTKFGGGCLYV